MSRSFCYSDPIWIYISLGIDCLVKTRNYSTFVWLSLSVRSGSVMRIYYSKQVFLAHPIGLGVSTALKGTHFYIFICFPELFFCFFFVCLHAHGPKGSLHCENLVIR